MRGKECRGWPTNLENWKNDVNLVMPWKNRKNALNLSLNLEFLLKKSESQLSITLRPIANVWIVFKCLWIWFSKEFRVFVLFLLNFAVFLHEFYVISFILFRSYLRILVQFYVSSMFLVPFHIISQILLRFFVRFCFFSLEDFDYCAIFTSSFGSFFSFN